MISVAERWSAHRGWTAATALGLALVWVVAAPAQLPSGGLAPLAVTALVAAALGVPLARAEWRLPAPATSAGRLLGDAVDLWAVLLVAAAAATLARGSTWALGAAVLAWVVLPLSSRTRGLPVPVLTTLAVAVALLGLRPSAPWTLLAPGWSTSGDWLPAALTGGLVIAAAGLGQWRGAPRAPGTGRLPWAVAGGGVAVVLVVALGAGAAWEVTTDLATPSLLGAGALATGAAAGALGVRPGRGSTWLRAGFGAAATAWWAGPAWEALPAWWHTLLPLGLAVAAVKVAGGAQGGGRIAAGLAAVVALAAAALGWSGFPEMGASAALAALVSAVVWVAGTRAVLGRAP